MRTLDQYATEKKANAFLYDALKALGLTLEVRTQGNDGDAVDGGAFAQEA